MRNLIYEKKSAEICEIKGKEAVNARTVQRTAKALITIYTALVANLSYDSQALPEAVEASLSTSTANDLGISQSSVDRYTNWAKSIKAVDCYTSTKAREN